MPPAPESNAARSRDSVRAGVAQFCTHCTRQPRTARRSRFGTTGGDWGQPLRAQRAGTAFRARPSACPSPLHPLREQSSVMLNFVFQELPLWGGLHSQPCLDSYHCVCKEASKKRFS